MQGHVDINYRVTVITYLGSRSKILGGWDIVGAGYFSACCDKSMCVYKYDCVGSGDRAVMRLTSGIEREKTN